MKEEKEPLLPFGLLLAALLLGVIVLVRYVFL